MIFGSVCSGMEGASEAWKRLGWKLKFVAEIEAAPAKVITHHHPGVINYGDFTTIGPDAGPIDVLVGGTPCQAFSVAGLRGGLGDSRGNLTLEFLGLAQRLKPRWVVYENVPGVLSSVSHDAPDPLPPDVDVDLLEDGTEMEVGDEYDSEELHAFNCLLAGLSELGYGWAYRIFDAQHFGVPQRRRRVFVVGCLGDWRPASAVLLNPYGLSGDAPPRREAREATANSTRGGTSSGGGRRLIMAFGGGNPAAIEVATTCNAHGGTGRIDFESETFVTAPLTSNPYADRASEEANLICVHGSQDPIVSDQAFPVGRNQGQETVIAFRASGQDGYTPSPICPPLTSTDGGGTVPTVAVPHAVAIPILEAGARTVASTTDPRAGMGIGEDGDPMFTLQSGKQHAVAFKASHFTRDKDGAPSEITPPLSADADKGDQDTLVLAFDETQVTSAANRSNPQFGDPSHPLASSARPPAIAFTERGRADGRALESQEEIAYALTNPGEGGRTQSRQVLDAHMAVRRLTPLETLRLQGYPDDYLNIPGLSDSAKYKMIGNSWAIPVVRYIGERIDEVEKALRGERP